MRSTIFILAIMIFILKSGQSQNDLFGKVVRDSLLQYEWYNSNYSSYQPEVDWMDKLKKLDLTDVNIKIFIGTWCGDTRRELPRLMKVLASIGIPEDKILMYAVSNQDSIYKQSKLREEKGYSIFRVGTYIFEKQGREINRIIEYPRYSIEQDIFMILSGQSYTPQYPVYKVIEKWLMEGTLKSPNISAWNLESQVKNLITKSGEFNGCGYVLMANGLEQEALKIFQINTLLYPDNSNVWHSMAECAFKLGKTGLSEVCIEKGLLAQGASELIKDYLNLHKKLSIMTKNK